MTKKDLVITLPNQHLRGRSKKISIITPELRRVIENMKAATLDWEANRPHELGVALAAIQIDQPYKIIIIRNNFEDKDDRTFSVFINPEIIKVEGELEEDYEGCLSVKDIYGKVPRYNKARLRALGEEGQTVRVKAQGFLARVFQHEVDHINGVMFVDHIKDKPDSFFKLTDDGKLINITYDDATKANIFR